MPRAKSTAAPPPKSKKRRIEQYAHSDKQRLEDKLRQGRVLVRNWHALDWDTEEQLKKKRSVDKRGPKSDEAYVREVLGEMASAQNIVVINDEAHHAWRVPPKVRIAGVSKDELQEATKWIGGLDRIHRSRGILACFDLTATPFAPTGRKAATKRSSIGSSVISV